MLTIPSYDEIDEVTVFRDDVDLGRFYYLPRQPRIASRDGKPLFSFLKFQLPPERLNALGGGYLVFTAELTESDTVLAQVKSQLEQKLRAENPLVVNLPPVTLSSVDYLSGEVRLLVVQDNNLVTSVATSRPSLFANNTASVAVGLGELGAQLFHDALKLGANVAVIEYSLAFEARLPAVTINAHVDSKEVKTIVAEYATSTVEDEDTWGNSTKTQVAHRTSLAESMFSQGLMQLEIIKGSVELGQEDEDSLRAFAFAAVDDFVKERFLKGGTAVTPEDLKSEWMSYIHQDINATFDLNVTYRDVIKRQFFPNAAISSDMLGVPIDTVVLDIDLRTAPWYFNNLNVTVDTNFDFEKYGDIVHSVVGHFSYDAVKANGARITKRDSVVFTKTDRAAKAFKTPLAEVGRDTYHYEVEVHYKAGPVLSKVLLRKDDSARDVVLEVPNPGVLEVHLATDPQAFAANGLSSIEVELEYGDPRNAVPLKTDSMVLTKDTAEIVYARTVFAPIEQPYRLRYTYVIGASDGVAPQRITSAWETHREDRISIHTPFDSEFNLTIIPQVDWNDVAQLVVDLEYEDEGNDYLVHKTLSFSQAGLTTSPMAVWKFPLRDPELRSYRFSQKFLGVNGSAVVDDWETRDSDANTLLVGNAPAGVVVVEVDASDVGIGDTVRRVIVRLTYEDIPNGVLDTQTFVFRDTAPQVWSIARADASVDTYIYDVDYIMTTGPTKTMRDVVGTIGGDHEFLFLAEPP